VAHSGRTQGGTPCVDRQGKVDSCAGRSLSRRRRSRGAATPGAHVDDLPARASRRGTDSGAPAPRLRAHYAEATNLSPRVAGAWVSRSHWSRHQGDDQGWAAGPIVRFIRRPAPALGRKRLLPAAGRPSRSQRIAGTLLRGGDDRLTRWPGPPYRRLNRARPMEWSTPPDRARAGPRNGSPLVSDH